MSECSVAVSTSDLVYVSSDATSELHVLDHESHSVGVDGAEVAVFEETSEIALRGLLKSLKSLRGEANIRIGGAGDLSDKPLEGQSRYDYLDRLLESLDFLEGESPGSEPLSGLHDMHPCRQWSYLAFAAARAHILRTLLVMLGGARKR